MLKVLTAPKDFGPYMNVGKHSQRILALSEITAGNLELFHIKLNRCNHLQSMTVILMMDSASSRIFCMFVAAECLRARCCASTGGLLAGLVFSLHAAAQIGPPYLLVLRRCFCFYLY